MDKQIRSGQREIQKLMKSPSFRRQLSEAQSVRERDPDYAKKSKFESLSESKLLDKLDKYTLQKIEGISSHDLSKTRKYTSKESMGNDELQRRVDNLPKQYPPLKLSFPFSSVKKSMGLLEPPKIKKQIMKKK